MNQVACSSNTAVQTKEDDSEQTSTKLRILPQERHVASHHRSMSADFSCTAPLITVKKRVKEPQPPPRGASLVNTHVTSHPTSKRYSCPPIGMRHAPSSSSSSSSCSSPPPVQTSAIAGHDPLGWKLRPKSTSQSSKRLSLQIPLPVPEQLPTRRASKSDPVPKTPRRHNSDSSALLRCMPMPLPVKTVEELQQVCLRPMAQVHIYDDVFSSRKEEDNPDWTRTAKDAKVPPMVPYKSPMTRQIAQVMVESHRQEKTQEDIYSTVLKTKTDQSEK